MQSPLGHSRPLKVNTEKLALPSISQVQTRGPVETPWYNSHLSQRSIISGDRLPDLHLPQQYVSPSGYSTSRAGALPLQTSTYPTDPGIGLGTPSPSPTSQCSEPPHQGTQNISSDHSAYSQASQHSQAYGQSAPRFASTMNSQQQYVGSEQSQMSAGQPYQTQPTTAGGMPQYISYQTQPPVLQPGHSGYAPVPYQYGYPNGVTSPQSAGHPVSSSMGPQMNSGLLPLPSKFIKWAIPEEFLINFQSNGSRWSYTAYLYWSANGTASRISSAKRRYEWSSGTFRHETPSNSDSLGR